MHYNHFEIGLATNDVTVSSSKLYFLCSPLQSEYSFAVQPTPQLEMMQMSSIITSKYMQVA